MKTDVRVEGQRIYAAKTGLKFGAKGRVQHPHQLLQKLTKSQRRKIRQALHREGRFDLIAQSLGGE